MKARSLFLALLTMGSTVLVMTPKALADVEEMTGYEETVSVQIDDPTFDATMDELDFVAQQMINGESLYEVGAEKSCKTFSGVASYYALHSKTASGEMMNPNKLTAAHRSLPFGTCLRVSFSGKSVVVRVNDRGPFVKSGGQYSRVLDLSKAAASRIGLIQAGHGRVSIDACVGGC